MVGIYLDYSRNGVCLGVACLSKQIKSINGKTIFKTNWTNKGHSEKREISQET